MPWMRQAKRLPRTGCNHNVGDLKAHTQKSKVIHCKRKLGRNTASVQLQYSRLPIHIGDAEVQLALAAKVAVNPRN